MSKYIWEIPDDDLEKTKDAKYSKYKGNKFKEVFNYRHENRQKSILLDDVLGEKYGHWQQYFICYLPNFEPFF